LVLVVLLVQVSQLEVLRVLILFLQLSHLLVAVAVHRVMFARVETVVQVVAQTREARQVQPVPQARVIMAAAQEVAALLAAVEAAEQVQ
jgi:hypothetical protein